MQPTIQKPSFHSVPQEHPSSRAIEEECKRMVKDNHKMEMGEIEPYFVNFPYLLRLILTIYYTLSKKLVSIESTAYQGSYFLNPITTHLKYSLLKLLAKVIQKNLYVSPQPTQIYDELSYSLVIKQCLFSLLLSVISENKTLVTVEKLITFYKNLTSEQYIVFIPLHVYHLYGGGIFTIQARTFQQKLATMIECLGKVLSSSQTIINRNIQFFKGNKERQPLLDESVKVVILSKNKESRTSVINGITSSIFIGKQYLSKEEFICKLEEKSIQPILTIFLKLIQAETLLFQEKAFRLSLHTNQRSNVPNFYSNQLSKLFSKCPFNGDEQCDCKKCQCVRRNRVSAKLSQDRKRNAVEQVSTQQKRIQELEQKEIIHKLRITNLEQAVKMQQKMGLYLEQQNLMLKSLLKEMIGIPNPNFNLNTSMCKAENLAELTQ